MHEKKRLYRSEKDSVVFGVIGGIGEFFEIDPSLLRLFWVLIVAFTGFFPGIIAYILAALVVPIKQ